MYGIGFEQKIPKKKNLIENPRNLILQLDFFHPNKWHAQRGYNVYIDRTRVSASDVWTKKVHKNQSFAGAI